MVNRKDTPTFAVSWKAIGIGGDTKREMIDEKMLSTLPEKRNWILRLPIQRATMWFPLLLFFFAVGYFAVSCHYWASAEECGRKGEKFMRQLHKMVMTLLDWFHDLENSQLITERLQKRALSDIFPLSSKLGKLFSSFISTLNPSTNIFLVKQFFLSKTRSAYCLFWKIVKSFFDFYFP